jgi:hypothetical protein
MIYTVVRCATRALKVVVNEAANVLEMHIKVIMRINCEANFGLANSE